MEDWMSEFGEIPLNRLIIPASHNSGTYNITARSKVSPDAPTPLAALVPCIVAPIAKCQNYDLIEQLNSGVRIFDLRIIHRGAEQWIVHGQYSVNIAEAFEDFSEWLDDHPKEIVTILISFLDYPDPEPIIKLIGSEKLASYPELGPTNLLKDFWTAQKNCIIVVNGSEGVWPWLSTVVSTWPNQQDCDSLKAWQDQDLPTKFGATIWIAQLILTPTFSTVICGETPRTFAKEIDQVLLNWLKEWKSQGRALNGIMTDFTGCSKDLLSELIKLNRT